MPNSKPKNPKEIFAFQMDGLEDIKLDTDNSFLIAAAAQARGYQLFFYEPKNLFLNNGKVLARGFFANIRRDLNESSYTIQENCCLDLKEARVIMIRQDPPFDMNYITTTYILEMLPDNVLVLNDPTNVRSFAEKISPLLFNNFTPNYILTANKDELLKFSSSLREIVLKPLYQHGGRDVVLLSKNMTDFELKLEGYLEKFGYVIAQEYIEDVAVNGDKRVVILDGEVLGFFRRIPLPGDFRSNTVLGGSFEECTLNEKEYDICHAVGRFLKENNLLIAGIDILNERLIEINVTSPSGITILNELYNLTLEEKIIDVIENKLRS